MAEDLKVKMDCALPKDGIVKLFFGLSLAGMQWAESATVAGGGNTGQIAAFMFARAIDNRAGWLRGIFEQAAVFSFKWPEENYMWMNVYGSGVKIDGVLLPVGAVLEFKYEPSATAANAGLCIILKAGEIGFSGAVNASGNPISGFVPVYAGQAGASDRKGEGPGDKIYCCIDGYFYKINGENFISYDAGASFKIETLTRVGG